MFILAIIIYVIGFFLGGPLWPVQITFGEAGPLGVILGIGWWILLFAGLSN